MLFDDRTSEKKLNKLSEKQRIKRAKKENKTLLIENKYYFSDGSTLGVPIKEDGSLDIFNEDFLKKVRYRESIISGKQISKVSDSRVTSITTIPEYEFGKTTSAPFYFEGKDSDDAGYLKYLFDYIRPSPKDYRNNSTRYNNISLAMFQNFAYGSIDNEYKGNTQRVYNSTENLNILIDEFDPVINEYYNSYKNNLIKEINKLRGKENNEENRELLKELNQKLDKFEGWNGKDYKDLFYHQSLIRTLERESWNGSKPGLQEVFEKEPGLKSLFETTLNNVMFNWEAKAILDNTIKYYSI